MKTLDRSQDILVVEQVGRTQSLTPEGFLLCEGVRIARTGPMLYAPHEVPDIEAGSNAMVVLDRDAECLFDALTLASFVGKPVTNDHPDDMVTPQNWREASVGIVLCPRRGEGAEAEYLLADLLITDAAAISDVQSGRREVSCGYESDREQVKPGLGRMTKIVGNHVALVDKGRCGPACAIQDSGDKSMAKRSVWDRMRTAFKAKDEAAFEEELQNAIEANEDGPEGSPPVVVHVHNAPGENPVSEADKAAADEGGADPMAALVATVEKISARLDAIEAGVAKNAEAEANEVETTDEASGDDDKSESDVQEEKSADKPVMDSAALRNSFTDTLAKAEILSPGVKLPVFDAKKSRKLTIDAMCDVRKRALSAALKDDARKVHVLKVVGGAAPDVSKMTCDTAAIVFNAASELARVANNAGAAAEHRPELRTGPMTAVKYAEMLAARRKKNA